MNTSLGLSLISLCGSVAALLVATDHTLPKQPPEPSRDLCEEVAHELNLWYLEGNIEAEEAHRIIQRCFRTFG